ncbi:hypothetical protein FWK35_00003559, partial [Aphis craccivora]
AFFAETTFSWSFNYSFLVRAFFFRTRFFSFFNCWLSSSFLYWRISSSELSSSELSSDSAFLTGTTFLAGS